MILRLSKVEIFEDISEKGTVSYGINYTFGDCYNENSVKRLNTICDTITFREHCRFATGAYPMHLESINYGIGGRDHSIVFHNVPLSYVKRAADKIANVLNTTCVCPYTVAT